MDIIKAIKEALQEKYEIGPRCIICNEPIGEPVCPICAELIKQIDGEILRNEASEIEESEK